MSVLDVVVRPLSVDDLAQVCQLDEESGNDVSWGLDSEEYAWGIFLGDVLIGYCTLGGADDPEFGYDKFKEWTCDSLCLSDVFVKPEHRHQGYALRLVGEVLAAAGAVPAKEDIETLEAQILSASSLAARWRFLHGCLLF